MRPQVDSQNLRITAGEQSWSFEVDCRADCARIELAGTEYEIRPLRWRDKLVLSRFITAGETFLKREFVRVSLVEPVKLPAGDDALSVLFELARWYNSPGGRDALPFDSKMLSLVTLELCRGTALAPEHFDQRSADEVEAMWQAVRLTKSESNESREEINTARSGGRFFSDEIESPGVTKILIIPDEPETGRASNSDTAAPREAQSLTETADAELGAMEPTEARKPVTDDAFEPSIGTEALSTQEPQGPTRLVERNRTLGTAKSGIDLKAIASRDFSKRVRVSYPRSRASRTTDQQASHHEIDAPQPIEQQTPVQKSDLQKRGTEQPREQLRAEPLDSSAKSESTKLKSISDQNRSDGPGESGLVVANSETRSPGTAQHQIEPPVSREQKSSSGRSSTGEGNPKLSRSARNIPDTVDPDRTPQSRDSQSVLPDGPRVRSRADVPLDGDWTRITVNAAHSPVIESAPRAQEANTAEQPYSYLLDSRGLLATLPPLMRPSQNRFVDEIQQPAGDGQTEASSDSDPESFFDEMADRLEQAASQLGIDVEY